MNAVSASSNEETSWESSVSCWIDGEAELRAEELDTPYGRQIWDTYTLIGDVMRSSDLAIEPSDRFYARISQAIDAEPNIVAPISLTKNKITRFAIPGMAVIAVVSMVWLAQPLLFENVQTVQTVSASTPVLAQNDETPKPPKTIEYDPSLAEYMAAHQAMAGAGPIRQVSYDLMGGRR